MPELTGLQINLNQAPAYLEALRDQQVVSISDLAQSEMSAPINEVLAKGGTGAFLDIPLSSTQTD